MAQKYNQKFLVPYLRGVVFVHLSGLLDTNYTPGMVRIPKDMDTKGKKVGIVTRIQNRVFHILFSEEGAVTNFLVVAIHMLIILSIPL